MSNRSWWNDRCYYEFNGIKSLSKSCYIDYRIYSFKFLWKRKLQILLKYRKKGKIIDIGCAYGFFLKHLPESFKKYGIDISEFTIDEAKKRFQFNFLVHDMQRPLNCWKNFDVATCWETLEHIPKLNKAIKHIYSLLKCGGFFFMSVPLKSSILVHFNRDPTHINIFEKEFWINKLSKKFRILETKINSFWGLTLASRKIDIYKNLKTKNI